MGQEKIKLPTTADGWAVRLSGLIKFARAAQGLPRFPIDIGMLAADYSRNVFPSKPITLVRGESLGSKFEGTLAANPNAKGEWGIFYNRSITSKGRINFTLGHEFGHYLMHRSKGGQAILCSRRDMWAWDSAYGQMEAEANRFASALLMPYDDFREQTSEFRKPSLMQFEMLSDRYAVSLTAAILKWLETTSRRAMLVVSRDGFIDWSWGSEALFKSGVFFRARHETIPVPDASLAAIGAGSGLSEIQHPAGIWNHREPVYESVLFSEYHDMTLSLLHFPIAAPARWSACLEDLVG